MFNYIHHNVTGALLTIFNSWQRQLSQPQEVHLLDGDPIGSHRDRGISDFVRGPPLPPALAPLLVAGLALVAHGPRTPLSSPTPAAAHGPLVAAETPALVRGLLFTRRVHQVKG